MNTKNASKKTDLSTRISKIRAVFCGNNNTKFAQETGISVQMASSICTGNKPAGNQTLDRILRAFPRVSRAWLIVGDGDMLRPEPAPSFSADVVTNTALDLVNGDLIQGKDIHLPSNQTDLDRLITMLENKDRQIDRLIALLEVKSNLA